MNTIDRLAGGDITKWKAAMTVSYSDAITKLELDMERDAFNLRLFEIRNPPTK